MMQFLNLETEYAYEIAWQFLLGYLYEPHRQGKGLTPAQLAHLLDKMQQFAAAKSPNVAGQMAEYKQVLDQPTNRAGVKRKKPRAGV